MKKMIIIKKEMKRKKNLIKNKLKISNYYHKNK